MGCSLQLSSAHGILQARIREWVAIPFSRGSSWLRDWTCVSCKSPALSGRFFTTHTTWEALGARKGCLWGRDTKLSQKFLPTVVPREIKFSVELSVEFSRQEYWSGLPFPPPRNLPDPGIEPLSLMSPALTGRFFTTSITWEAQSLSYLVEIVTLITKCCPRPCWEYFISTWTELPSENLKTSEFWKWSDFKES